MTSNSSNQSIRIIVDADSCPVMGEITRASENYGVKVVLITSFAHFGEKPGSLTEVIYVDNIPQAADIAIVNQLTAGDLVITGDYGLASLIVAKDAHCISPRGLIFSKRNIERLLEERHLSAKIRRGGGRTKGPKAFTKIDKQRFYDKLVRLIQGIPN